LHGWQENTNNFSKPRQRNHLKQEVDPAGASAGLGDSRNFTPATQPATSHPATLQSSHLQWWSWGGGAGQSDAALIIDAQFNYSKDPTVDMHARRGASSMQVVAAANSFKQFRPASASPSAGHYDG
jgi:hypothetical protein